MLEVLKADSPSVSPTRHFVDEGKGKLALRTVVGTATSPPLLHGILENHRSNHHIKNRFRVTDDSWEGTDGSTRKTFTSIEVLPLFL